MDNVESSSAKAILAQETKAKKRSFGAFANAVFKRGLDILAAAFGLLLLSPVFLFLAILIKRDSRGPVFFRCARAGRNGKIIQILKFRTMHECAESYDGPSITARDDPRITPSGRWLRSSKLNELPQLWNVLKGEMSLVGPRPEDPEIVATWPAEVRLELLSVRPGITSPASVIYRNEEESLSSETVMTDYLHKILPDKLDYSVNEEGLIEIDLKAPKKPPVPAKKK